MPSQRQAPVAPPRLHRGDIVLLGEMRAAQVVESTPRTNWALYLMALVVVCVFIWASLARVNEITNAEARIVPDGREQVIASLEGGILRELLVSEGTQVFEGQDLAQLDPTRFEAQQNEGQGKVLALKATAVRLTAEANGQPLRFPPEMSAIPTAVEGETEAYAARQRALNEAVGANHRSVALLQRELRLAESLAAKGLMSDVEVMRLNREVNDLKLQSQERINRYRQEASTELVRVRTEMAQLQEQMVIRDDALRRTVLKSPVRGLIKNIRINTVGGVVAPGAPIMEIVPISQRVLVEARIKPSDIGFIRVGQAATVKLSAYDYTTYGGLLGKIQYISPDALADPARATSSDATYYRALVRADRSTLRARGKPLPVIPGMTGVVEMHTGERSVLSFILRPMLKSREAFRER
ncbi:MAG: HlyD family type I secretion periplasmic adaptor subunit [Burkholderiaceae bacterium]|nr:HlyD family type I secretion periplasmic adaptor subunit [Burkholderiaceae bacterium]